MTPLPDYSIYWDLPVLIVVVSIVYSATRYDEWGAIVRESVSWGRRMTGFLVGIGAVLYFLAWWMDSGHGWWVLALAGGAVALVMLTVFAFLSKPAPTPR